MKVTAEINNTERAVKETSNAIIVADLAIYYVSVSRMEEFMEV